MKFAAFFPIFTAAKKKPVMFMASLYYSFSGSNKTIIFNNTITSQGSGYNPKTGIFTVPSGGEYLFSWQISTYSTNYCQTYLSKNGKAIQKVQARGGPDTRFGPTASATVIVLLKQMDRVWLHTYTCSYLSGDLTTSFMGWKIA